jgi:hypothetical protein
MQSSACRCALCAEAFGDTHHSLRLQMQCCNMLPSWTSACRSCTTHATAWASACRLQHQAAVHIILLIFCIRYSQNCCSSTTKAPECCYWACSPGLLHADRTDGGGHLAHRQAVVQVAGGVAAALQLQRQRDVLAHCRVQEAPSAYHMRHACRIVSHHSHSGSQELAGHLQCVQRHQRRAAH